jgi:hypothetical protein
MAKDKGSKASTHSATDKAVERLRDIATGCDALRRQCPATSALSTADRQASSGRFRVGEAAVLRAILDVVDARPALFSVLAAHDGGANPAAVETSPAREALARKAAADEALAAAELLVKALRDDSLVSGEAVRALTTPAYAIIKANATVDAALRDEASEAIGFYRDSVKPKSKKP